MSNFDSTSRSSLRLYLDSLPNSPSEQTTADCRPDDSIQQTRIDRQQRELDRLAGVSNPKTVSLTVGQIVPLLMDAMESNRAWLQDFADDTVRIDSDLYDVLLAYQQIIDRKAA